MDIDVETKQILSKKIEGYFSQLTAVLAKNFSDNQAAGQENEKQLLTNKQSKERLEHEILRGCIDIKQRLQNGTKVILEALVNIAAGDNTIQLREVGDDFAKLINCFLQMPKQSLEDLELLKQDHTIDEIAKIRPSTMQALYSAAKHLYESKQYEEAADAFGLLTMINSKQSAFWMGCGNSQYFCQRYEPALLAYAAAYFANPEDPHCHIFSCCCYEALKDFPNAINALDLALYILEADPQDRSLKEQVQAKRQFLRNKTATSTVRE